MDDENIENIECCLQDAYIIHDLRPALHGDALKDGQHGEKDIVERGDAVVRSVPAVLDALDVVHLDEYLVRAREAARRGLGATRPEFALARHNEFSCNNKYKNIRTNRLLRERERGRQRARTHCGRVEAGGVKDAVVHLEADDGEYDNGEQDEHHDLEQRNHRLYDGFQNNLKTFCCFCCYCCFS